MAKKLTSEEYLSSNMDPVALFSAPVCSHMNGDHEDDMKVDCSQVLVSPLFLGTGFMHPFWHPIDYNTAGVVVLRN